jgi:hypothetical protein
MVFQRHLGNTVWAAFTLNSKWNEFQEHSGHAVLEKIGPWIEYGNSGCLPTVLMIYVYPFAHLPRPPIGSRGLAQHPMKPRTYSCATTTTTEIFSLRGYH